MGLYSSLAKLIIEKKADYRLGKGTAITLGVHHFNYNREQLESMFRDSGTAAATDKLIFNDRVKAPWMRKDAMDARTFFYWLGYTGVEEIDAHADEAPTIIHDLNQPIPDRLCGKYDLVFDGGTSEHVFDVKNCLFNAVNLLKPGGTVIHAVPLTGWVNHGFIQYSPRMFWDFYNASGFSQIKAFVLQVSRVTGFPIRIWELKEPSHEPLLFNDFNCKTLLVFFAQKTEKSVATIPMQGSYSDATLSQYVLPVDCGECEHIARSEPIIRILTGKYARKVTLLWKIFPLNFFSALHSFLLERIYHRRFVANRAIKSDPL